MIDESEIEHVDSKATAKKREKLEQIIEQFMNHSTFCAHTGLKETIENLIENEESVSLNKLLEEYAKAIVWDNQKNSTSYKVKYILNKN
mgnify:CR=1 FL=1